MFFEYLFYNNHTLPISTQFKNSQVDEIIISKSSCRQDKERVSLVYTKMHLQLGIVRKKRWDMRAGRGAETEGLNAGEGGSIQTQS